MGNVSLEFIVLKIEGTFQRIVDGPVKQLVSCYAYPPNEITKRNRYLPIFFCFHSDGRLDNRLWSTLREDNFSKCPIFAGSIPDNLLCDKKISSAPIIFPID